MRPYSLYIVTTALSAIGLYVLVIVALYQVESKFHLPVFNHISLDRKLHFLKDHEELDTADTVIIGSSMGLNNINGVMLENTSKYVHGVINLSAWSIKCPQILPLLTKVVKDGKVKRIIYAAQYFDFTQEFNIDGASADTVFGYLNEDPLDKLLFIISASRNLLSMIENYLRWESFTNPETYEYLIFDRTGGNQLDINKENANPHRWSKVDDFTIEPFGKANLTCLKDMADLSETHHFDLIFVVQPFREAVVASNPQLKEIMFEFDKQTKAILNNENSYHINAHEILNFDDSNFADKSHLNIKGANAKTKKLAKMIDRISSNPRKPKL